MSSNNSRIVSPDTTAYIQNRKLDIKSEINCMAIGTVQNFNSVEQTCDVQINYLRVIQGGQPADAPNNDTVNNKLVSYPLLVRCPLVIMQGGGCSLTFPVETGDECVLLFNDRDIDAWWTSGNVSSAPNSPRMHDLNDALILVGVNSLAAKMPNYNMNGPQLMNGNTSALVACEDRIKIQVASITLGNTLNLIMVQLIALAAEIDPGIAGTLTTLQAVLNGILK